MRNSICIAVIISLPLTLTASNKFKRKSKNSYREIVNRPDELKDKALDLYKNKKYLDASLCFSALIFGYPNYYMNDRFIINFGDCLIKLHLDDIARNLFNHALSEYNSVYLKAKYAFYLIYLEYKNKEYENALEYYNKHLDLINNSEIKTDVDYILGQIYYSQGKYEKADSLLSCREDTLYHHAGEARWEGGVGKFLCRDGRYYSIEDMPKTIGIGEMCSENSNYHYSHLTLSCINIQLGKVIPAIVYLYEIINSKDTIKAPFILKEMAKLKLGQLYFEQDSLRKANTIFNEFPLSSPFSDQALLGISWAWLSANRPQESQIAIEKVIKHDSASFFIPECYLLKGYNHYLKWEYDQATIAFNNCLKSIEYCSQKENKLNEIKNSLENYFQKSIHLKNKLNQYFLNNQSMVQKDQDIKSEEEIKEYFKNKKEYSNITAKIDNVKSRTKNYPKIKSDAILILQLVKRKSKNKGGRKKLYKTDQDQKYLDDEINKLEKMLEDLK